MYVIKIVEKRRKHTRFIVNSASFELLLLRYCVHIFCRDVAIRYAEEYCVMTCFVLHLLSLHYHINDKIIQHQFTNQVCSMTQEFFAFFFSFSIFISALVSVSDLPPSQMSPRLQITIFNSITEEFIVHSFSGEHKLYSHVDFFMCFPI